MLRRGGSCPSGRVLRRSGIVTSLAGITLGGKHTFSHARALAAARNPSRRRDSMASASGSARTTASMCLQMSGSLLTVRNSARCGWILLNVAKISPCAARVQSRELRRISQGREWPGKCRVPHGAWLLGLLHWSPLVLLMRPEQRISLCWDAS